MNDARLSGVARLPEGKRWIKVAEGLSITTLLYVKLYAENSNSLSGGFVSHKFVGLNDKLITHSMNRNDVFRIVRRVFDFLPQLGDVHINGAREREAAVAPD